MNSYKIYIFLFIIALLLYFFGFYLYKRFISNPKFVYKNNIGNNLISILRNYIKQLRKFETNIKLNIYNNKKINRLEVLKVYCSSIKDFTSSEQNRLKILTNEIINDVIEFPTLYHQFNWNFVKLDSDIEWGMPFTLGEYIFLPENIFNMNDIELKSTLLHEQIHVIQRKNQKKFNLMYTKFLGFKKINNCVKGEYLDKYRVSNPDGMDVNWIYKSGMHWIMPMLMMNPNNTNNIEEYGVYVNNKKGIYNVDLTGGGNEPVMLPLNKISEYRKDFKRSSGIYHPNEYLAHSIEDAVYKNSKHAKLLLKLFFN